MSVQYKSSSLGEKEFSLVIGQMKESMGAYEAIESITRTALERLNLTEEQRLRFEAVREANRNRRTAVSGEV